MSEYKWDFKYGEPDEECLRYYRTILGGESSKRPAVRPERVTALAQLLLKRAEDAEELRRNDRDH